MGRLLALVGPWPIRPVFISFLLGCISLLIASGTVLGSQSGALRGLALAVLPAAAVVIASIFALTMIRRWVAESHNLLLYLVALLLAAAFAIGVRTATEIAMGQMSPPPGILIAATLRYWAWMVVVLAFVGTLMQRVRREADATQAALARQRRQEQLLLLSEERARQQVATALHDRVQAGLIAIALELRLATDVAGGVDREAIAHAIGRLEDLRNLDVRNAAHALSPDLINVDLRTALEVLAATYRPGMDTTITVAAGISPASIHGDVLLGAYRIIEQGLLNAAAHGQAHTCEVNVSSSGSNVLIEIHDDGRGIKGSAPEPGMGLNLVDTWCRALSGEWELRQGQSGATLTASLSSSAK